MDPGGNPNTKNRNQTIKVIVIAPAVNQYFDIEVSFHMTLKELRDVLCSWMSERTKGQFVQHEKNLLIRAIDGSLLQNEATLDEIGVQTNETLYLF